MVEYTKDKCIDQKHHNLLQWARTTQNMIRYENELELINLIRDNISISQIIFLYHY